MKLLTQKEIVEIILDRDVNLEVVNGFGGWSTPEYVFIFDHVNKKWVGATWEEIVNHNSDAHELKEAMELILKQ